MSYILAENLKNKRSFVKKLLIISPLFVVALSFVLMPTYFATNSYNWWYIIVLPAMISLIAGLVNLRDEKKLNYKAVFSLDIDLKKIWISKILTIAIYVAVTIMIHMMLTFLVQSMIGQIVVQYEFLQLLLASFLLLIANIWQIPLCLFLAKKLGFIWAVVINTILGIGLGIRFADTSLWIFSPYSYASRMMISVLKILPNGLITDSLNQITTSLPVAIIVSLSLFAILTIITANWFSKLEVK